MTNIILPALVYIRIKTGITEVYSITWYMMVAGITLFLYCRFLIYLKPLKETGEKRPSQKLITYGPYKYTRHPMYTAMVLFIFPIFFSKPIPESLIFYFLIVMLLGGFIILSYLQEKETLDRFGEECIEYYKRTPRLFFMYPFTRGSRK